MLIAVAYSHETPVLCDVLRQMRARQDHRRIALGGLDEAAVGAMLEHAAGAAVSPRC